MSVRVGIIGFGYASATFHAPLITQVPGLDLVAICSRDARKVLEVHPSVAVEPTPESLLARGDLDLIVIPTPNDSHFPLACAALEAGKHVVVDKPFTITLQEAQALERKAADANRLLSVFHNRRWDGDFLGVKEVIRSGRLGALSQFESHFDRFRPGVKDRWREAAGPGSGLWYDLGPHLLDQVLQLFGQPDGLQVDLATQREGAQVPDWFHAVLGYGPMRVVLHAGSLVARSAGRFMLHGRMGSLFKQGLDVQEEQLKAGLPVQDEAWGRDPNPLVLTLRQGSALVEIREACPPGNHAAYYEGLREAILGRGPNPVPPSEAVQVMAWIDAGLRSAREGRRVDLQG